MPYAINPPPSDEATQAARVTSEPPAAKIGRAHIDAGGDALQNLGALGIIAYAWLEKGALDKYEALAAMGVVLGLLNVASVIDRFTHRRIPRAPLSMLVHVAGKTFAAGAAAEVARRSMMLAAFAFLAGGCALWAAAKPFAKILNDAAIEFCEATMGAEAERQGMSVQDLCVIPYVLEPILRAHQGALDAAKAGGPLPERCATSTGGEAAP